MQGRYAEAEALYRKVISIREKVLGGDHPDTKASYHALLELYKIQGKKKETK